MNCSKLLVLLLAACAIAVLVAQYLAMTNRSVEGLSLEAMLEEMKMEYIHGDLANIGVVDVATLELMDQSRVDELGLEAGDRDKLLQLLEWRRWRPGGASARRKGRAKGRRAGVVGCEDAR